MGPPLAARVQRVQKVLPKGFEKRFLRLTGPMGRRVLRFDGPLGRGLWYRPTGDEYICRFAAIYIGACRRRTSPAAAYFITTLGGALNQSGRRQPVPDRTLGAQGRQPRRRHQPSRRSRVNLREYSKTPLVTQKNPPRRVDFLIQLQPIRGRSWSPAGVPTLPRRIRQGS